MTPEQQRRIHRFWAQAYGFDPALLEQPGHSLVALESLAAPPRFVVFRTQAHALVFAPPALADTVRRGLAHLGGQVVTADDVQAALGGVETTRGNTDFILYFNEAFETNPDDDRVRPLEAHDAAALEALNAAASERDRELGEVSLEDDVVLGWFDGESLLGAASLVVEDDVGDVGVLTHPAARGRGIGRALVARLALEGVRRGLLVQYTTMASNVGSVKVAEAVGFAQYAVEEALRVAVEGA